MKIKHFAGYGYVHAVKTGDDIVDTVYDGTYRRIQVTVWGNHEYGLVREDNNGWVYRWLVRRFVRGYYEQDVVTYSTVDTHRKLDGIDVEHCIYTIILREKRKTC